MAKKTAPAAKKKEIPTMLVQSKVKEFIREHDMMCSSDLIDSLNEHVATMLNRAIERAAKNSRKTARGHDI